MQQSNTATSAAPSESADARLDARLDAWLAAYADGLAEEARRLADQILVTPDIEVGTALFGELDALLGLRRLALALVGFTL